MEIFLKELKQYQNINVFPN